VDPMKVQQVLSSRHEPRFRLSQILDAVYKDGAASYSDITTLPAALREALEPEAPILSLREERTVVSKDGRARKAVLALADGQRIESVLLKPKPGDAWSACISTQVGCAVGCSFCATGLMGFRRDLTVEEVTDQVVFWRQYLRREGVPGRLTNVVYMGMGEPFHCYETTAASLRALTDPERLGLAQRHVSVSTVGLVPGIRRFADDFPQVNLALSLHAAEDELRSRLVPAAKAYPLAALAEALGYYLEKTGRKVFLEYVLLDGENDGAVHADALVRWVRACGRPGLLHVNLIAWNPTKTAHAPATAEKARAFKERLIEKGVHVTIRKSLGQDIEGACGQLIA